MTFNKVNPKQSFPDLERKWIATWKKKKTFEKSIKENPKSKEYIFYDGPPFATGLPHYGHILAGTMKDIVPRYQTMKGRRVERRFGWDCHGLPIENLIEKDLKLETKKDIENIGVAKFNDACKASVLKYAGEWEQTVDRMGRWVDFKNDYKTMNLDFMESIWWVFNELWKKDLIYKGHKAMHICPRCETPLSNFEVTLGYQDITDYSVYAKFEVVEASEKLAKITKGKKTYILAWTTTPWTLPGNVMLAVHPELTYGAYDMDGSIYICAKSLAPKVFGDMPYVELGTLHGKDLAQTKYEPLIPYFKTKCSKYYYVVDAQFVTDSDGTGIVHTASGYGEEDMKLAKLHDLPMLQHVGMNGRFIDEVKIFAGMEVKPKEDPTKTDRKIAEWMKENGKLFKGENYRHSYPHCWRCDSPLLNFATEAWFVKIDKIKPIMLRENKKVHWVPDHVGHARFQEWLTNARDWCISRTRYWGTPLPIWIGEKSGTVKCIGSVKELEKLSKKKVKDLHKQYVDALTFKIDGETYRRIPEVLDCWFESGSMPYAQMHYPFENKKRFESNFPAEFIAEGLDQTRGWFYTLMVLGCGLFDKTPYKNVIVNGLVLAEDGKKMSKKLKNYPDPARVFDQYGADALRMYIINSPVVKSEPLRFSEQGVADVVRTIHLPLWNAYQFFVTYANIDKWKPSSKPQSSKNSLDIWILSELEKLLESVTKAMDSYDLQKSVENIPLFIDSLTNWYIRRSRRRFWRSENDRDKKYAYDTLYQCLVKTSQIIAPFMPFLSEEIYTNLTGEESVHLTKWAKVKKTLINNKLNESMSATRMIVALGHAIRGRKQIKVRQPLRGIKVALSKKVQIDTNVICEELNIKSMEIVKSPEEIAIAVLKPDSKKIGPKFGSKVQNIIADAKAGKYSLAKNGTAKVFGCTLESDEYSIEYISKEGYDVASEKGIVVALDTEITPELTEEGLARDMIRCIQDMRKEVDFKVDDRIITYIHASDTLLKALETHIEYIKDETLSNNLILSATNDMPHTCEIKKSCELEGHVCVVGLARK